MKDKENATESKKAVESLLHTKNFTDSIISSLPGIFYLFDINGKFLRWNDNFARVTGFSSEEIVAMKPLDFFADDDKNLVEEKIREVFTKGESSVEADLIAKNGAGIRFFFTGRRVEIDDFNYLVGMGIDVSKHKRAEDDLRRSEERYRAFIEHSSEGIWRFELSEPIPVDLPVSRQLELFYERCRLAECNDIKAQHYGFEKAEELFGKRLDEFLVESDSINENYLKNFIESDYQLTDTETIEKDKNGDNKYFLNNLVGVVEDGKLLRAWGTQRDITALKQARQTYLESEEQLRRSQKVEAIGRLAGGVAHDFNNFLAVIMLQADMLNLQLPPESPLRYRVEEIKSVANNAAAMVRQLLAFGRKQTLQPHAIILNQIVREFIKILRPLIGEDIEVELDFDKDLGVCFVDPDQMTQVLMNLAVNARDAMPTGGVLKIETSNIDLNKHLLKLDTQPVGEYVQLKVSDSGSGMSAEVRQRIFEPFFTTKEPNKGTGLGLATVYGIVKQSNGFIWVDSEIGRGTTFQIQFPRIDQAVKSKSEEEAITMPTGTETILLVEDEEQVRRAALEVLKALGYQVFEASSGLQAIQLAEIYKDPIDLLLTDVIMPRMNGRDLAKQVKALHPETAVLYMSGYDDDIISNHGVLEENVRFLNKPFTPSKLAEKVREVLSAE